MSTELFLRPVFVFLILLIPFFLKAQYSDFSHAAVLLASDSNKAIRMAAEVFRDVTNERAKIDLPLITGNWNGGRQAIFIGTESQLSFLPQRFRLAINRLPPTKKEGYRILYLPEENFVFIIGHDERGALYGVGYLLRKMLLYNKQILVPGSLSISAAPAYPIRGHQLGYRPKTNAYDAWTVDQFDHYIRDLAIFGANSIEIMPPHTDDDFTNAHMKLLAIKMIAEQSRICKKYDLDVWMWYPNMGSDYVSPDSVEKELNEHAKVFSVLPKLDALFVPGGDPGDLQPELLFKWLDKLSVVLHRYHPKAKIWVSPQVFRPTEKWYDAFYKEINKRYSWLGGVVYGPWVKETIRTVRMRVRKDIPIRRYPDITHSLSSQYPVQEWDLAYAITLGRECYNPRPVAEKHIQNVFAKYAQGSISYSEGINDDVNKFIWSGQDWDPNTPVMETLRDYARLFIGPDYTETVAKGILDLENNFKGPLLTNESVGGTLHEWQDMEKSASPEVLSDFRFQMCLLRAYYDAYTQRRLFYEKELEQECRDLLSAAGQTGSLKAINDARQTLLKSIAHPVRPDLRARCFALADSVYRSIGSQITVKEPQAAKDGRGNFLDFIDLPLNDSQWFLSQFEHIEKMPTEEERLQAIDSLLHRTDPGPGGFYINLGAPGTWDYVVRQKTGEEDPGGLESPFIDFGASLKGEEWVDILPKGFKGQAIPQSWMNYVTTLYDTPLKMHFNHLDPHSSYILRIAYTGRFNSKIKLIANQKFLIHDYLETAKQPLYEFPIPPAALAKGDLRLTWTCTPGDRGTQVAEIWIIKK